MKKQTKIVLLYILLGVVAAVLSLDFGKMYIKIAISVFGMYIISVLPLFLWLRKTETVVWILKNTLVTYILVWLTTWILLYNLTMI
ncbi:MAG: hypothetical protein J7K98_03650 [Candidatus Aenigmarchaeota archaeon]|nr:hypothetical protein [Candidatus Aenigmarchaeota archaeon]